MNFSSGWHSADVGGREEQARRQVAHQPRQTTASDRPRQVLAGNGPRLSTVAIVLSPLVVFTVNVHCMSPLAVDVSDRRRIRRGGRGSVWRCDQHSWQR